MHTVPTIALLVICLAPLVAEQNDRARIPKKGDTIIVKGCLRGSSVEHASVIREDAEGKREDVDEVPSYTYRLQGDKKLLKDLRDKHDRKVVEVKGILRSSLTGSGFGTT